MRNAALGLVAGLVLSTTTTGTAAVASTTPGWRCGAVVHLTNADGGSRIRVCRGAHLEVTLRAPISDTPDTWWKPVTATGHALTATPDHGMGTAARGVTLASFTATHSGTSVLRSHRIACPINPSGPPCHPTARWHVTVRVG